MYEHKFKNYYKSTKKSNSAANRNGTIFTIVYCFTFLPATYTL